MRRPYTDCDLTEREPHGVFAAIADGAWWGVLAFVAVALGWLILFAILMG